MKKLRWCLKIKDGIRIKKPSDEIARSYLELSKSSLRSAETVLKKNDLIWSTVMIYYAEYYALYSFLAKIGVKCENHFCSILLAKFLLEKEEIKTIEKHRENRIDAQYYLKVQGEKEIENMLRESKFFVAEFEELVTNLSEREISEFREKMKNI